LTALFVEGDHVARSDNMVKNRSIEMKLSDKLLENIKFKVERLVTLERRIAKMRLEAKEIKAMEARIRILNARLAFIPKIELEAREVRAYIVRTRQALAKAMEQAK
jgi:hypothetical protein